MPQVLRDYFSLCEEESKCVLGRVLQAVEKCRVFPPVLKEYWYRL